MADFENNVNGQDIAPSSVDTEKINNSVVNLTALVNNGDYDNIIEAIGTEPGTNPQGTYHYIEPGGYSPTPSQQYTVSQRNFAVGHPGSINNWMSAVDRHAPVKLKIDYSTIGDTTAPIQLGDGSNITNGQLFEGIHFEPQTLDTGGEHLLEVPATGESDKVFNVSFNRCTWRRFGGDVFDIDTTQFAFGWEFRRCGWLDNAEKVNIGRQAALYSPVVRSPSTGTPAVDLDNRSYAVNAIHRGGSGGPAFKLGSWTRLHARNLEGTSGSDGVIVEGNSSNPAFVTGAFFGYDNGIVVKNGAVIANTLTFEGNVGTHIRFEGGNNDHNNSYYVVRSPYDVENVNGANFKAQAFATTPGDYTLSDMKPARGMRAIDTNRGGTGNYAILQTIDNGQVLYFDAGGTL